MVKQILAHRTKAERRSERGSIGSLGEYRIQAATLHRYRNSFDAFREFVRRLARRRSGTTFELIGFALVQYLKHLWQEGEGISIGNYTSRVYCILSRPFGRSCSVPDEFSRDGIVSNCRRVQHLPL